MSDELENKTCEQNDHKLLELATGVVNRLLREDREKFLSKIGPAIILAFDLVFTNYNNMRKRLKSGKAILPEFVPEFEHKKTKGTYCVILEQDVMLESTWRPGVLYMNSEGVLVVRDKEEFNDGRFEKIAQEPAD